LRERYKEPTVTRGLPQKKDQDAENSSKAGGMTLNG